MAEVIDLFLQRAADERLDHILETKGLAYFLRPGGGVPILLDEGRVWETVTSAVERLGRTPVSSSVEACYRAVRRRLIARLAEAMVYVGY